MAFNLALHQPLGGGFESFQEPTFWLYAPDPTNVHDSHSIYFQMMGHHGFIGLAIFLSLAACTWFSASQVIRAAKRDKATTWLRDLMAAVQISLIAYLTTGAFLGLAYFDYFYNLVLMVVVGRAIIARNDAKLSERTGAQSGAGRARSAPAAASRTAGNATSSAQSRATAR
jgi:probable O-glycosylation ligase (exosortase A-associated)